MDRELSADYRGVAALHANRNCLLDVTNSHSQ